MPTCSLCFLHCRGSSPFHYAQTLNRFLLFDTRSNIVDNGHWARVQPCRHGPAWRRSRRHPRGPCQDEAHAAPRLPACRPGRAWATPKRDIAQRRLAGMYGTTARMLRYRAKRCLSEGAKACGPAAAHPTERRPSQGAFQGRPARPKRSLQAPFQSTLLDIQNGNGDGHTGEHGRP